MDRLLKAALRQSHQTLRYLGRYTHRVAISNQRLVSFAGGQVTFHWRDSAHGNQQRLLTLSLHEFLRRFLLHLLPPRFVRIRYFGFLASRRRAALLPLCRQLIPTTTLSEPTPEAPATEHPVAVWTCPLCGGRMRVVERLSAAQIRLRSPPLPLAAQLFLLGRFRYSTKTYHFHLRRGRRRAISAAAPTARPIRST